jgi:enoyl-CoA hydratase/carnithine racemase
MGYSPAKTEESEKAGRSHAVLITERGSYARIFDAAFRSKRPRSHLTLNRPKAFSAGKRPMHAGRKESLESQIEQELHRIAVMKRIEDAREAIAAFVAKRAPQFKGR